MSTLEAKYDCSKNPYILVSLFQWLVLQLGQLRFQDLDFLISRANENFTVATWRTAVEGPQVFELET